MKKSRKTLAKREGLQSVIDNSRKSAAAGYPDFTADDPATFVADFLIQKEREGMSLDRALQALIAFKRNRRS
ncbi:hypothetical protein [Pseudomonas mandelii]|uniref:Uncharacterized protein n=1 Tax=Pseudomonas mandelii TaxID=75612 RepID=A0A502I9Y3_9PSED|nr:hypothetical protein [Pseudomonas mandelii]TPG83739.1 hypothetical protein EAH74_12615 [Pseudomonas mandelii]